MKKKKKSLIGFFSYKAYNGYFFSPILALHMCLSILSSHQPGCGCWASGFCFSSYPHQMTPAARDSKVTTTDLWFELSIPNLWKENPHFLVAFISISKWHSLSQMSLCHPLPPHLPCHSGCVWVLVISIFFKAWFIFYVEDNNSRFLEP